VFSSDVKELGQVMYQKPNAWSILPPVRVYTLPNLAPLIHTPSLLFGGAQQK